MRLTTADIQRYLDDRVPEGPRLDYKGDTWHPRKGEGWEAKHECAKDVAAFANHRGGHILVGISEDRPGGLGKAEPGTLTGRSGGLAAETQVKDWLAQVLRPNALARLVEVYTLTVQGNPVLVVDVPAWSSKGVAVVEWGEFADRKGYFAPIRDGDKTRSLLMHEIEGRLRATPAPAPTVPKLKWQAHLDDLSTCTQNLWRVALRRLVADLEADTHIRSKLPSEPTAPGQPGFLWGEADIPGRIEDHAKQAYLAIKYFMQELPEPAGWGTDGHPLVRARKGEVRPNRWSERRADLLGCYIQPLVRWAEQVHRTRTQPSTTLFQLFSGPPFMQPLKKRGG